MTETIIIHNKKEKHMVEVIALHNEIERETHAGEEPSDEKKGSTYKQKLENQR
jgi:hypothetical protein